MEASKPYATPGPPSPYLAVLLQQAQVTMITAMLGVGYGVTYVDRAGATRYRETRDLEGTLARLVELRNLHVVAP